MEKKDIGDRFRFIRQQLGLSQQALGIKIGKTQGNICDFEKNIRLPPRECLKQLSEEFQVNVNWLLTGVGNWKISDVSGNPEGNQGSSNVEDLLREDIRQRDEALKGRDEIIRKLEAENKALRNELSKQVIF